MSPTWLSPFAAVWHQSYPDAQVPFKQLARYLAPLVKAHPADRVAAELGAYLRKTPAQFLNLAKFAATFGSWARPEPPKPKPYQWRSVDECDRAAGIEVPE